MTNYDRPLEKEGPYLPRGLRDGVRRYIEDGEYPGSFLRAVLNNNLREAFATADADNRQLLFHIVAWFYNEAPGPCWGSEEAVKAWPALVQKASDGKGVPA